MGIDVSEAMIKMAETFQRVCNKQFFF